MALPDAVPRWHSLAHRCATTAHRRHTLGFFSAIDEAKMESEGAASLGFAQELS
jgi:hypothetical protein